MKKETKITVTSISLGGMEFTADSVSLKRHRIYEIKLLKAASPHSKIDLCYYERMSLQSVIVYEHSK